MYRSSDREEAARQKLYEHVRELRESLLDLLSMVDDRVCAVTDVPVPEPERLRRAAAQAEHRAFKIKRARAVIDGTNEAERLTGPQGS